MIVYVDEDLHCHIDNDGTRRAVETDFFNGKCSQFISGYSYNDTEDYIKISPWKPYDKLSMAQEAYEEAEEITKIITGEVSINDEG